MLFGILNRMIFWELVKVFLLSLTGLTGLFLIGGIIQQATQYGVSASQLLNIIPLLIPSFLPYTIPATMLFATCIVYGRLSHDNEAVALKAAGVDLLTMIRPAFVLGLLTSAVTAGLEFAVIPMTQRMLQEELIRDPEERVYSLLKQERCIRLQKLPYYLYVRDVQDRRLIDVVVKRKPPAKDDGSPADDSKFDYVARTREARLVIDKQTNTLTVETDTNWVISGNKAIVDSQDNQPFEIVLPDIFRRDKLMESLKDRSQTIDWDDLPERVAFFKGEADKALITRQVLMDSKPGQQLTVLEQFQIAEANGLKPSQVSLDPDQRAKQVGHFTEVNKYYIRLSRTMDWDYHSRPALALGCLFFAVIGCPMGIWANRADYLSMFVICFLPAIIIYYPLIMAGAGFARDGKVPMVIGVWGANAAAAIAGVLLMWRLIRR